MVSEDRKRVREASRIQRQRARSLRQEQTPAELKFWYAVRDRRLEGLKFRRQVPIGNYIADFLCSEHHLIVELDGGQHADSVVRDGKRDAWLIEQGFTVLRFWNHEVLTSMDGVIVKMLATIRERDGGQLPLSPASAGERAG